MSRILDRYKMRLMIPAVLFFVVASAASTALVKTMTGPTEYSTTVPLHSSAGAWTEMAASQVHLRGFLQQNSLSARPLVDSVAPADFVRPIGMSDIEVLSASIFEQMKMKANRRSGTLVATITHNDPSVIKSFYIPYFSYLNETYYSTWIDTYKAIENDLSARPDSAVDAALPSGKLISVASTRALLKGDPIIATPLTEPGLHLGFGLISIIASVLGLVAALPAYLALNFWKPIMAFLGYASPEPVPHRASQNHS